VVITEKSKSVMAMDSRKAMAIDMTAPIIPPATNPEKIEIMKLAPTTIARLLITLKNVAPGEFLYLVYWKNILHTLLVSS